MKRILSLASITAIFTITLLSISPRGVAQPGTVDLFCERFDSLPWDMTTYGIPAVVVNGFEPDSLVTRSSSLYSATDTIVANSVNARARSYIQTPNLSITGFTSVGAQFEHICYLSQFDEMRLQASFDGGASWFTCGPSTYTGNSFMQGGGYFNKLSRPVDWKYTPTNDTNFIWTSANANWAVETYDITSLINVIQPPPDSMMLRIELRDGGGGEIGGVGTHRYYLENFCVRGSNCELTPPDIALDDPPSNYPARYEDRVYWTGPYDFNAQITDASTIDTAYVKIRVRRDTGTTGPDYYTVFDDTIGMNRVSNSYFNVQVTDAMIGDNFQIADSVYWRVIAVDGSPCRNVAGEPSTDLPMESFQIRGNIPKTCKTQPIFNFPYVQDFDDPVFTPSQSPFIGQDWENGEGDFHNWWVNSGPTGTTNTGPTDDHPGGGKYLYVEASGNLGQTAFLLTPCVDLFELPNTLVRFYLHQNTVSDGGTVHVDAFDPTPTPNFPNGKFINDFIPPITGNKGDNWLPYEFTTYQIRNQVTQFRFRTTPSNLSEESDVALDSFKIEYAPLHDMRANDVILPPYTPVGEKGDVTIGVQNLGVFDVTSLKLNYDVYLEDDGTIVDSARDVDWTGLIPPGTDQNIIVPNVSPGDSTYVIPRGRYLIKVWIEAQTDEVVKNDTTISATTGLPYRAIYFQDDFDGDDSTFTIITDNDSVQNFWELGKPNYDVTNSTFSEPNSWDVLLDRPYATTGSTVQLLTPFLDFSGAQDVFLSFFNNRDMNEQRDGVYLQASFDQGETWTDSITTAQDPGRTRWYNSNLSGAFGGYLAFSKRTRAMPGNWNNWVESELMLLADSFDNKPMVLFRFNFFAQDVDRPGNDGMSIDNFLVYDRKPIDITPQYLFQPKDKCSMTSTERFRTCFKNRGETVINGFDVKYVVKHMPSQNVEEYTETVNRTVNPRDTVYSLSLSQFDMRSLGLYEVSVITQLSGDGYAINDTLTKMVENIDGCSLTFEVVTYPEYKTEAITDSSVWRFNYTTSDGEKFEVSDNYVPFSPDNISRIPVCIEKNSFVKFSLGDVDTAIVNYSLYAYDGEKDIVIVDQAVGGSDAPAQFFEWECPPEISAKPLEIILDNGNPGLPLARDYFVDVEFYNNGLDSIASVEVGLSIDKTIYTQIESRNPPIEYRESDTASFGTKFLSVGSHELCAWTHDPNGNMDQLPEDDTICRTYTVIDTSLNINTVGIDSIFCSDFEDIQHDTLAWVAMNFLNFRQDYTVSFERETPSTTDLNGAHSGTKAWVTDADSSYVTFDNSALFSPFIKLEKDSCYLLSFYHNYSFDDDFHDGGNVRMSTDEGNTWKTLNYKEIGVGDTLLQENWYNKKNIIAMPDNDLNAGWSGNSGGYVKSQTIIPVYDSDHALFAFRFGSDGNNNGEGWAIDDVCIGRVPDTVSCFAVGLGEKELNPSKFYLGQNVPNPSGDRTEIPIYLPNFGEVDFHVTNMMGQTVYSESMTKSSGNHLIKLDVGNWSNGIYYYWVIYEGRNVSKKMIVNH